MSKRLIVFLVSTIMIIVFVFGGIPYLQGISPSNMKNGDRQVHMVDGIYESNINRVKIGNYSSASFEELSEEDRLFASSVMQERGVFQKGDIVMLSLGKDSFHQKISFLRQVVKSNEVRIYVKLEEDKSQIQNDQPSYLLGHISLPPSMPISFIDEKTGNLLY